MLLEKINKCELCKDLLEIKCDDLFINKFHEKYPALGKSYGVGNKNAKILIVGLSPSYHRCLTAKELHPFNFKTQIQENVGSGKIMYDCMRKCNINFDDVYITNLFKCSFLEDKNNYTSDHLNNCIKFLKEEIETINPKIIILLGKSVSKYFRQSEILKEKNIRTFDLFHPAYIQRNYSMLNKYLEQWKNIERVIKECY